MPPLLIGLMHWPTASGEAHLHDINSSTTGATRGL